MSWIDRLNATIDKCIDEAVAREHARCHAAFEQAMRETWQMIDPIRPPPPGTYALGEHNGIAAALRTVRDNYERANRNAGVETCGEPQGEKQ
jgi:hypothetical protein